MPNEVQATKGQAALVLPANPAEIVVVPPSARNTTSPSRGAIAARPLPKGFQANIQVGVHESGWPLMIVGDRDGAPMVLVPGGTFTMGNNDGQSSEKPAHEVRLSTYYIDQHEVTNHQFRFSSARRAIMVNPPPESGWPTRKPERSPRHSPSDTSTFTTPTPMLAGPASSFPPRRNGRWPRDRPRPAFSLGQRARPNGPVPERSARSIR